MVLLFLVSCAGMERKPLSQLDTPEHHTYTGIKLMNQGKYVDAEREFILASKLNPAFSRAYAGSGLVAAYQGDFRNAFDLMKKAGEFSKTKGERVLYHVGMLRLFTMSKPGEDWCDRAESEFAAAVQLDQKCAAAYYFMGIANKMALKFDKAAPLFAKVLDLNDEYLREADREWKLMRKIERAMPGTKRGRQIVLAESITRADLAALLMEELNIGRIYEKLAMKEYDRASGDDGTYKTEKESRSMRLADIEKHAFRDNIEDIARIGIRGLEVYPDGTFRPYDLITRATYATIIEDILIAVEQDKGLAKKFAGKVSPFPDLRSGADCFNAVMVATSRGIMQASDLTSGEFLPFSSVSGVDALLIIRNMQKELRYF